MRTAPLFAFALLACTAQREIKDDRDAAAPQVASPVSPAPAQRTADLAPAGDAITASEAAALYASGKREAGAPGDAAASDCESDAECAFTSVAPGACCPMLCTPRAVPKKVAQELEARIGTCNGGKGCPVPACRPPAREMKSACVQRRCVARPVDAR